MRRAAPLVGGALAAAVVVAVAATRHAAVASGSPIEPRGAWDAVWIAALVGAFLLYGLGVLLSARMTLVVAVVVAVVVQLAPLFAPLLLSRDVYLYWAEARVVTVHGANPYRVTPSRYPDDPATRQASAQWRTQPEPYGPGWVALGTLPALTAGRSAHRAELFYRLFASAAMLAALALLAWTTRSARAVAFLGWSPLLALHLAGGGHSDAWIGLALVAGVALRATATGGVAWPLGSAIKGVPAVVLPLELARARLRFPRRFWVALIAGGVAVIVPATAFFGVKWVTAATIGAHGTSPIGGVHFLTEAGLRHRYAVLVAGFVFVAIYAALLREAWVRGRARLALAMVAFCMCSSLLRPWYAVWPVALAAAEEDGAGQLAAYALSAYVLFADAIP
ncbi:MAG TPA: hypothetical protein VFB25_08490 [Gaiellaceae bacterium]|nr:hypothetical protein [Gaiellaceae bacterium]